MIVINDRDNDERLEEVLAGLKGEYAKSHLQTIEKGKRYSLFAVSFTETEERLFIYRSVKGEEADELFLFSVNTAEIWAKRTCYGTCASTQIGPYADPLQVLLHPDEYAAAYKDREWP